MNISRRIHAFIRCLVAAGLLAAPAPAAAGTPKPKVPGRIVLVTIDTLRADHLQMYGYPRRTAPFLEQIAQKGILYERMYSASSHTAPCHATMFTSLYPDQHGVLQNGQSFVTHEPTMAEILGKKGYATGGFTSVEFITEVMRGFEEKNIPNVVWTAPRKAAETVDAALQWAARLPRKQKAFMWLHLFDVHNSTEKETEFVTWQKELEADPESMSDADMRWYWPERTGTSPALLASTGLADQIRSYDARIRYTDEQIGRLYRELTKPGEPPTMFIITADHGEGLGSHEYLPHDGAIFEEQNHIPLIVAFSDGQYAGTRVREMTRQLDLLPSLCAGLGVKPNPAWEGHPQWPFADQAVSRETFVTRRPRRQRENWNVDRLYALRDDRWKILWSPKGDLLSVFDMRSDPLELHDLAQNDPVHTQALIDRISAEYRRITLHAPTAPNPINPAHVEELKSLGYLQ